MDFQEMRQDLRGPTVVVPTPFEEDGSLNRAGMREHLEFLASNGYEDGSGSVLVGAVMGQFYTMTDEERIELARLAVDAVGDRVTLGFGAQHLGASSAIKLADAAEAAGVDYLQLSPPLYGTFGGRTYGSLQGPETTNRIVETFFEKIASAVDVPFVVYNVPYAIGYDMPADVLTHIAGLDNVVGAKWHSENLGNYLDGFRECADEITMIDNGAVVSRSVGHYLGAGGIAPSMDNFAAPYDRELWNLLEAGRYDAAEEKFRALFLPFYSIMAEEPSPPTATFLAAMETAGRTVGVVRPPSERVTENTRERLHDLLAGQGIV
jgi:4-hydroxy-tetrahydrodipicolinate synthase